MSEVLLNQSRLEEVISEFDDFLNGEGQEYQEERSDKGKFFNKYFKEKEIENIDEGILRELIDNLWAFGGWTNKDYLLNEMMKSGLEEIRNGFSILLYSDKSLEKRFNYVKENIRMLGSAGISEILAHFEDNCAIWSRRTREGLLWLGVNKKNIKSHIDGKKYSDYCKLCNEVLEIVKDETDLVQDLIELDFMLFYISQYKEEDKVEETIAGESVTEFTAEDFSHEDVIEEVAQLGDGLGFEVETEYAVGPGCRIDVLWRSRVANLGTIKYGFEVHRRGSRDSAILNLQRILRQEQAIQKVVLVSYKKEIEAFKSEISGLSEEFRNAVCYFEVEDLQESLNHLDLMKEILDDVGLII